MNSAMNVMPTTGVVAILVALGLSVATFYRRRRPAEPRRLRTSPARALSAGEREHVLALLHAPRFADKAPAEILATLLEEGQFPCSERTMYRILEANSEVRERRDQLRHPAYTKPELIAVRPSQVWTWDITKLRTHVKFQYLYLYVIIDIYSRYIVGWLLADRESAQLAERLVKETCEKHGVTPDYLHADRGAAMKSKLLSQLDIERSHSRPHVSNDNPFSESQFKTLKYHPSFPDNRRPVAAEHAELLANELTGGRLGDELEPLVVGMSQYGRWRRLRSTVWKCRRRSAMRARWARARWPGGERRSERHAPRPSRRSDPTSGGSPTACLGASPTPRTWSRRRFSGGSVPTSRGCARRVGSSRPPWPGWRSTRSMRRSAVARCTSGRGSPSPSPAQPLPASPQTRSRSPSRC